MENKVPVLTTIKFWSSETMLKDLDINSNLVQNYPWTWIVTILAILSIDLLYKTDLEEVRHI